MTVRATLLAQCITDERLTILAVDDAYLALVGRERREIVGRSPLTFTAPVDRAVNDVLFQRLRVEGRAFAITKRYLRGDGGVQWVRNHVGLFRDGVGSARVIATCEARAEPPLANDVAWVRQDALTLARTLDAARRAFGGDLTATSALEVLLHLYLAEMEGRSLTPRCLAALTGQAEQTTLRWLRVLSERRLAEVERDGPLDLAAPMRIAAAAQRRMEEIASLYRHQPD
ncbi:MAG: PAS domain-containing protein [Sphingomonas taxi]